MYSTVINIFARCLVISYFLLPPSVLSAFNIQSSSEQITSKKSSELREDTSRKGVREVLSAQPHFFWKFKSKGGFFSSPAVASDRVIIGDSAGKLSCLSVQDGKKIWGKRFSAYFRASPVVSGSEVFIASARKEVWYEEERSGGLFGGSSRLTCLTEEKGEVRCLELKRGRKIWRRRFPDLVHSTPALAPGRLVIGCYDYSVYCLNRKDGRILWSFKTAGPVISSPLIVAGHVLVGSLDGSIYCLALDTGHKSWSYNTGEGIVSSPVYDAGRVYIGSKNRYLYCLAIRTGKPIWKFKTGGSLPAAPVLHFHWVYVGSEDGKIYCLQAKDGREIWSFRTSDGIYSSPVIDSGRVIFSSSNGKLYCLKADNGQVLWKYSLSRNTPAWLTMAGGKIFAACTDRNLYCLAEEEIDKKNQLDYK